MQESEISSVFVHLHSRIPSQCQQVRTGARAAPENAYSDGQCDGGQLDLAQVATEYGADKVYQEDQQLDQDLSARKRRGEDQRWR